jgi:hypothetical protein
MLWKQGVKRIAHYPSSDNIPFFFLKKSQTKKNIAGSCSYSTLSSISLCCAGTDVDDVDYF